MLQGKLVRFLQARPHVFHLALNDPRQVVTLVGGGPGPRPGGPAPVPQAKPAAPPPQVGWDGVGWGGVGWGREVKGCRSDGAAGASLAPRAMLPCWNALEARERGAVPAVARRPTKRTHWHVPCRTANRCATNARRPPLARPRSALCHPTSTCPTPCPGPRTLGGSKAPTWQPQCCRALRLLRAR